MTTRIDLTELPFPTVVDPIDLEALIAEIKADLIADNPDWADALNLESEPLTKFVELLAYRITLQTNKINEKAKALMLAYAAGSDLDNIGVNVDVYRLVIVPANPNTVPPTPAVMEQDDAYRRRIQLAPERDSAGSEGFYIYWALSSHGDVRDAAVIVSEPGHVQLWIQSHTFDIAPQTLLDTVTTTLDPATRRPATDYLTVHAATPVTWSVNAELTLFPGPDSTVVVAAAQVALDKYTALVSYLGYDVVDSGLKAALHQAGVQRVRINTPTADLVLPRSQYAKCTGTTIATVEFRDV